MDEIIVPYDRYGDTNRFILRILSPEGLIVPRLQSARDSIGARGVRLDAGERLSELINLYDEYAIDGPGKYRITATFESDGIYYVRSATPGEFPARPGWKGAIVTAVGTISVALPAEEPDIAALVALRPSEAAMPSQGGVKFPW